LRLCDACRRRAGSWPRRERDAGEAIPGTNGDGWEAVDGALRHGRRGLPGGSSLARRLAGRRGVRNIADLPPLTIRQILAWADAHRERIGHWPRLREWREEIPGSGGETWGNVAQALAKGLRGLPGGFTLWGLLTKH